MIDDEGLWRTIFDRSATKRSRDNSDNSFHFLKCPFLTVADPHDCRFYIKKLTK
jgi:hypothetical protein